MKTKIISILIILAFIACQSTPAYKIRRTVCLKLSDGVIDTVKIADSNGTWFPLNIFYHMIPMPEKHPINWINALENDPTYKGYAHVDSIKTIETDTIK